MLHLRPHSCDVTVRPHGNCDSCISQFMYYYPYLSQSQVTIKLLPLIASTRQMMIMSTSIPSQPTPIPIHIIDTDARRGFARPRGSSIELLHTNPCRKARKYKGRPHLITTSPSRRGTSAQSASSIGIPLYDYTVMGPQYTRKRSTRGTGRGTA